MMRPTINEESDCLREKNLRRRPCDLMPFSDIVSEYTSVLVCTSSNTLQ